MKKFIYKKLFYLSLVIMLSLSVFSTATASEFYNEYSSFWGDYWDAGGYRHQQNFTFPAASVADWIPLSSGGHQGYWAALNYESSFAGLGDSEWVQSLLCVSGPGGLSVCSLRVDTNNYTVTLPSDEYRNFDGADFYAHFFCNGAPVTCGNGSGIHNYYLEGRGRVVTIESFTAPASADVNSSIPITWTTDWANSAAITNVTGMSCSQTGSVSVDNPSGMTCTAGPTAGTASITLTADGPAQGGTSKPVSQTKNITIVSSGAPPPPANCTTPGATNINEPLPCQFPPTSCTDPAASNNGGPLPCTYPTSHRLDFYVHANCSAESIAGATVNVGSLWGTTDSSGYVSFVVNANTNYSWSASANGYSSNSGSVTSGGNGASSLKDVTLDRTCGGTPPPPPPPPPPITQCTDVSASNYGGPEPCIYTYCVDGATIMPIVDLPSSMVPGQTYPVRIQVTSTGSTWWYDGAWYSLRQTSPSPFTIVSTAATVLTYNYTNVNGINYGHLPDQISPNDYLSWTFNVTAPATPGQYTFKMQMRHQGGFTKDPSGNVCTPANTDIYFGEEYSKTVTVANPVVTTSATIPSTVLANGTSQYNLNVIGTNTYGASRLDKLDFIVNYQGTNGDGTQAKARGAGKYSPTNVYAVAPYTSAPYKNSVICGGAGGSAVVWNTFGPAYITLNACWVVDSGSTRTVTYNVSFNPLFATDGPLTLNDISSFAQDIPTAINTGWTNNDLNFSIGQSPTVTSPTATGLTSSGATLGANVTSLGTPASITARGTCWGTTPAPTSNCTAEGGLTTGVFTHARTGLSANTTYYYRGYATNSAGTGYSADSTFTTPPVGVVPTVTTPTASGITSTGATLGANVTSLGTPASITARGTCWGTTPAPTSNCTAEGGLTTGVFTHARTGLSANTTYYYRGYADNATGRGYSADGSFSTSAGTFTLTISSNPSPTGHVSSSVGGISCGTISGVNSTNCGPYAIAVGTSVTLTPTPASSYWKFSSWSGDCTGSGTCTLIINSNKAVTATFVKRVFDYDEF